MYANVRKILTSAYTETPPVDFFDWDPSEITRIHLLDKATGEKHPIVYEARAFAVFHHINAYEEDGQIVMDLCENDGTVYKKLFIEALKNNRGELPPSKPYR